MSSQGLQPATAADARIPDPGSRQGAERRPYRSATVRNVCGYVGPM